MADPATTGLTHDVIVVGAGPAGATAARVMALRGLRVALIDKAAFPRDKLCGGGVTGRAMGHLRAAFDDLPEALFHRCDDVRLMAGARVLGVETDGPPLFMTMRRDFDAALRARAMAAGADDFCGQRIAAMDLATGTLRLTGGAKVRAAVVIGADGVNSAVARALFGRAQDPAQVAFALEIEVPGATSSHLELDMVAARWGYGWDFPKAGGRTLGIGGAALRNDDLPQRFDQWLRARGIDPAQVRIKGHHLPMGEVKQVPGRDHVLLVGDAAGLVDPVTGEGIGWAVHSGQLAAEAAIEALSLGRPERTLALYQARAAHMMRELRRARLVAKIVYHPRLQPRFLDVMAQSRHTRRRYLDLLGGKMDYVDLGPARLARLALRLLLRRGGPAAG
ncbi:geranylgeranyl reductase family protein [Pseudotabrizicola sp. L79]|uniref:geranylgeranyl reductase family protein n=1 Tax=Pseudotabrizicola sp. L79 TaxID=3118402 RepID=UPI002F953AF1